MLQVAKNVSLLTSDVSYNNIYSDKDSRRDDLRRSNNKIKANNDELIERIEIHEETKVCIDKDMADQCSVSNEMLLTIETVNARIEEISASHEAEILKLNDIIRCSSDQLQRNILGATTTTACDISE